MAKRWNFGEGSLYQGDCLKVMRKLPEGSVDLVFGSPPYENVREYEELNFNLKGQDWVDWMVEVYRASLRVCKGLVAFVVGHGKNGCHNWSGVPALLAADLIRGGVTLRNPAFYVREGIMGSGGRDWLKARAEWIICATNRPEELPWSDNTACGHPPKHTEGGPPSHRNKQGTRVNLLARARELAEREGISKREAARRLEVKPWADLNANGTVRKFDQRGGKGSRKSGGIFINPDLCNPGNVIDCGASGGHNLGSNIAHDNEAPFPSKLPRFFIRSFCPPGGTVLDPFGGSGTTLAEAIKLGRKFISIDLRESQIKLMLRRIRQARINKGFGI